MSSVLNHFLARKIRFEKGTYFVICENTVVHDNECLIGIGALWVRVDLAGHAMGGPPGVCDAHMALRGGVELQLIGS